MFFLQQWDDKESRQKLTKVNAKVRKISLNCVTYCLKSYTLLFGSGIYLFHFVIGFRKSWFLGLAIPSQAARSINFMNAN